MTDSTPRIIPEEYKEFIKSRLEAGDDPNNIEGDIEDALPLVATDWAKWGDGRWRLDTVCSICGKAYAGACGHQGDPKQHVILRRKYEEAKAREALNA